jgi:hypothetical protein
MEVKFLNLQYVYYKIYSFIANTLLPIVGLGKKKINNIANNGNNDNANISGSGSSGAGDSGEILEIGNYNFELPDFFVTGSGNGLLDFLEKTGIFLIILSIPTLVFLAFKKIQMIKLRNEKFAIIEKNEETDDDSINERWQRVLEYLEKPDSASWRISIIEADILLDEILTEYGYLGETIADKLKSANFKTIQLAWDAHKIRNNIAHSGTEFPLTSHQAKKIINMYKQVFQELGIV